LTNILKCCRPRTYLIGHLFFFSSCGGDRKQTFDTPYVNCTCPFLELFCRTYVRPSPEAAGASTAYFLAVSSASWATPISKIDGGRFCADVATVVRQEPPRASLADTLVILANWFTLSAALTFIGVIYCFRCIRLKCYGKLNLNELLVGDRVAMKCAIFRLTHWVTWSTNIRVLNRTLTWLITLASLAIHALAQEPTSLLSADPIVTRQQAFTIPFHVPTGKDLVEIQLHVAEHPEMQWRLVSRQDPSAGGFPFRATRDGQFSFAVRSIDRNGRQYPAAQLRQEMLVVVDTTPPQLDLGLHSGTAGELHASWRATDERVDASSLRIEYRPDPDREWVPMAIDSVEPSSSDKRVVTGQASWWPRGSASVVLVRGHVKDSAGNATVVQRQIAMAPAAPPPAGSIATRERQRDLLTSTELPVQRRPDGAVAWSTTTTGRPSHTERDLSADNQLSGQAWVPRSEGDASWNGQHSNLGAPSTANRLTGSSRLAARTVSTALPRGVTPLQSRSTNFSLDYDLRMVGPTGVRAVHMWGTTDAGRSWTKWLTDKDRSSPIHIEAPHEGVYGFRMVVENNEGLALPPPQPGDAPDVWVVVDPIEPQVELTSAQYGRGADEGSLLITWKASDDHLSNRPVTLRYTSDPAAGWQTIAANLANLGQYTWRVDRHVPQRVFLRIEVRDQAGNVGVHEPGEPINTRGLVPQALIRGVRPIGE